MTVWVDFSTLWFPAYYEEGNNAIIVEQWRLRPGFVGYHKVTIYASYEEIDEETVTFEKQIYIEIRKP